MEDLVDQESNNDKTRTQIILTKGTMVSHYRIVDKIGAGGMGEVYLAEDTGLDRKVALKFLPSNLSQDEDCRARFKREAQAVAKLNHPNIVTIHEVSEFQGRPFFAMELIEGQSLRELSRNTELDLDRIVELAIQICDGLGAAHEKNIVHRDIKPSNIAIDAHGRPKILDFGLASIQGGELLTKTGSTLGTVRYMSPEQVEGKTVDHRSDLFSFGVVLYELIAGRTPFERANEGATLKSILGDDSEPLARYKSEVPDELQRIVSKLLSKDPSMRYQTASGVISDLKPLVNVTKSTITMVRTKQKNRLPQLIGGLAIIAVLFVAGLKYWPESERENTASISKSRIMLAIIPFENLGSQEDEYFADGITDEITSKIVTLKELGVIARTSVLQYKGTTKRVSEIGRELNVDYILEGTIRWDKSGPVDKVRILAQLIRVSDETHIWADNFQRDLSGIFEVQEQIATSIAGALNVTLLAGNQDNIPTNNMEAYDYYLRGLGLLREGADFQGLTEAINLFDKAVLLDDNFALAWAQKSIASSVFDFTSAHGAKSYREDAIKSADKAIALNPNLPEAHMALGTYYNLIENNYDKSLAEFAKAESEIHSNSVLSEAIGIVKMRQGKWGDALINLEKAAELDPLNIQRYFWLTLCNAYLRDYNMAGKYINRAFTIAPDDGDPVFGKIFINLMKYGRFESEEQSFKEITKLTGVAMPMSLSSGFAISFGLWRFLPKEYHTQEMIKELRSTKGKRVIESFYMNMGELFSLMGEADSANLYFDSARITLENIIDSGIEDHNIYSELGLTYARLGEFDEAEAAGKKGVELLPVSECHW